MDRRQFHVSAILLLIGISMLGATKEVAAPVAPPYASERKLLATDFVRIDWKDTKRDRDVPVKAYFPTDGSGPFPVILFSHGLGGTREGYEYLGRQWAASGYVVIHLQHPGSDDSAWRGKEHPMISMQEAASAKNGYDRCLDVNFVIDQLDALNKDDPKVKGKLDTTSIGMAGHSFGANTTMLVIGQRLRGGLGGEPAAGERADEEVQLEGEAEDEGDEEVARAEARAGEREERLEVPGGERDQSGFRTQPDADLRPAIRTTGGPHCRARRHHHHDKIVDARHRGRDSRHHRA